MKFALYASIFAITYGLRTQTTLVEGNDDLLFDNMYVMTGDADEQYLTKVGFNLAQLTEEKANILKGMSDNELINLLTGPE